jgi:hypothetical protein
VPNPKTHLPAISTHAQGYWVSVNGLMVGGLTKDRQKAERLARLLRHSNARVEVFGAHEYRVASL